MLYPFELRARIFGGLLQFTMSILPRTIPAPRHGPSLPTVTGFALRLCALTKLSRHGPGNIVVTMPLLRIIRCLPCNADR